MFDFHIHSENSPDSVQTLDEICEAAIKRGLAGIAICDHVDMWFFDKDKMYEGIQNSIRDVRLAKETYGDELWLFQGVELAEYLYDPIRADSIYQLCDYDVVLGSVHSLFYEDITDSYSRIDFSTMSEMQIYGFLAEYFHKMTDMIEKVDFDVLSHLTCPLRYINGKYKRNIDIMRFRDTIASIYEMIIKKEVALEVNTSGIGDFYGEYMPNAELLRMYFEMGGRLITIGSDAHIPQKVGNAFAQTKVLLRNIGFDSYCYYQKRQPKEIGL